MHWHIAKHWAKAQAGHSPQDAYQAFEILCQRGAQPADELNDWRKVIGLRNALVHDHLNIDPEIIRSVISQGYSDRLFRAGIGMVISEEGLNGASRLL
ncbi:type VII toxin-antitoxin system HepT family RNase toxin [Shewanella sp. M-Br]|uniref:type VII toxin-antitoxin system HepT family RNase toxin n=1 Tax=Shewanella sp. M-Br TaxID=2495595 RepID=UPI00294A6BA2|nr:hypothetical protein SMBr_26270 [Shewanella sp. M-Br]